MPRSAQETRPSVLLQHSLQLALTYLPNRSHLKHNSAGEVWRAKRKHLRPALWEAWKVMCNSHPSGSFSAFNKYTVDPWTTQVRNAYVHLYTFFFNKHRLGPLYPRVLHPKIQPTVGGKQYFPFEAGNPQMWRADWMLGSTPFYRTDSGICRFWYPLGVVEPYAWTMFLGYQGTTVVKVQGSQNLYMDFQLCSGQCSKLPTCSMVNCNLYITKSHRTIQVGPIWGKKYYKYAMCCSALLAWNMHC